VYDQWRRLHLAWYRFVHYKRQVRKWLDENEALAHNSGWYEWVQQEGSPASLKEQTAQVIMNLDDATNARFLARFQQEKGGR
jgi:hypothetical protein